MTVVPNQRRNRNSADDESLPRTVSLRSQAPLRTTAEDLGWFSRPAALGSHGLYALIVLILSTQPFFQLTYSSLRAQSIINAAWLIAFAVGLLLVIRSARLRWITWSIRKLPFLWLVLFVAFASSVWSLNPARTLDKAFWMAATTLVGVILGYLLPPKVFMRSLFWLFASVLVTSLLIELFVFGGASRWLGRMPDFHESVDRWQGITPNPNFLGPISAFGAVFFLVALLFGRLEWRSALPMCVLAALTTFMTRSATSIVMLVTGIAAAVCFRLAQRLHLGGDLAALLIVVGLVGCAATGLVHWEGATNLLEKDVTASNRFAIWDDSIKIVEHRPIRGYGFGAVWALYDKTFFPEFKSTRWQYHAHNGYLQIATEMGLPATVVAVILLIWTLIRGAAAYVKWHSSFALFCTIYTVMFVVGNMTEARLFEFAIFDWLLFVALATALARASSSSAPAVTSAGRRARNDLPGSER